MIKDSPVIEQTLNWVRSFIIEYSICPFAKAVVNKGTLRTVVSEQKKQALALEDLMTEIHYLEEHPAVDTTLLVFPHAFKDFFNYLDFIDNAERLMQDLEYEGVYQLASFHPDYYFADTEPDDVSNYTNRSPYPMIHLLREEQLDKAITAYGDTSTIPEKNIKTMRELGVGKIKKIMESL